jgi:hypothetical protein
MMLNPLILQGPRALFSTALVLAVIGYWDHPLLAQEPQPNVFRLQLSEMEGIEHGKAAVVKGDAGTEAQRFLVEGVTMETPVTVLLRGLAPEDEIDLALTKYAWNQPLKTGTAQGEPLAMKFRTEGEFQLSVTADEDGLPYRLLVWVGDPVAPALSPVVVRTDEYDGGNAQAAIGEGGGLVLWVIAALLGAAVLLLAVIVLRRKS